jgi:hypothetical protein
VFNEDPRRILSNGVKGRGKKRVISHPHPNSLPSRLSAGRGEGEIAGANLYFRAFSYRDSINGRKVEAR